MKGIILVVALLSSALGLMGCTSQMACGPDCGYAYAATSHCRSTCNTCVSSCRTCGYTSSYSDWY